MKIFKRPMFRKGGEVGGGIMTGLEKIIQMVLLKDLQNWLHNIQAQLQIHYQILIQGGLNLVSGPATGGGVLADAATAFKTYCRFIQSSAQGALEKEIALQGEVLDIEAEQAEKLARIKNQMKDQFAAETPEEQFEVLFKGYSDINNPILKGNAKNLATFEVLMNTKFPNKSYTQLSFEYGTDPRTRKKIIFHNGDQYLQVVLLLILKATWF